MEGPGQGRLVVVLDNGTAEVRFLDSVGAGDSAGRVDSGTEMMGEHGAVG